jgi:hypothetical protein
MRGEITKYPHLSGVVDHSHSAEHWLSTLWESLVQGLAVERRALLSSLTFKVFGSRALLSSLIFKVCGNAGTTLQRSPGEDSWPGRNPQVVVACAEAHYHRGAVPFRSNRVLDQGEAGLLPQHLAFLSLTAICPAHTQRERERERERESCFMTATLLLSP